MADVRSMKQVGSIKSDVSQQMSSGYQAQGFALAQTIIAAVQSQAQQLRMSVDTAFTYDAQAREACMDNLKKWQKDLAAAAKGNENLRKGGMSDRDLGAIARSAGTRVSEFSTICKAMNNGFTVDTIAKASGIKRDDVKDVSFHTIVALARKFVSTAAASTAQGRPSDPFAVKLAKFLDRQDVSGEDAKVMQAVKMALAAILPAEETEGADATKMVMHRRKDDKVQDAAKPAVKTPRVTLKTTTALARKVRDAQLATIANADKSLAPA